jgi:PAS domain S-box-containing protein
MIEAMSAASVSSGLDQLGTDAFLAALTRTSEDPIVGWTIDGTIVYWNDAAEALYGYAAAEIVGRDVRMLIPPEHAAEFAALQEEVQGGLRVRDHDATRKTPDGDELPVKLSISPVYGPGHAMVGYCSLTHDVTADEQRLEFLRDREREVAETLSALSTLQEAAPVGLGFVDREFRIIHINQMLADVQGHPAEEQVGKTLAEAVPAIWPQVEPIYRKVIEEGVAVRNVEVSGPSAAAPGATVRWLVSYYPVHAADDVIGVGLVVVDITDWTPRAT